jgi:hypothetical protein
MDGRSIAEKQAIELLTPRDQITAAIAGLAPPAGPKPLRRGEGPGHD